VFVSFTVGMALAEAARWVAWLGVNHCVLATQHRFVLLAFLLSRSFAFFDFEPHRHIGFLKPALVPHNVWVLYTRVTQWFGTHMSHGTNASSEVQRGILLAYTFLRLCLLWRRGVVSDTLRRTRTARVV